MVVMFKANPAAQAFVEYLTTPEASEIWAKRGGFSSPNKKVDKAVYPGRDSTDDRGRDR